MQDIWHQGNNKQDEKQVKEIRNAKSKDRDAQLAVGCRRTDMKLAGGSEIV